MNKDINLLKTYEEDLIIRFILEDKKFTKKNTELNEDKIQSINANLHLTDNQNIAFQAHNKITDCLINYYCKNKHNINYLPLNNSIEEDFLKRLELDSIPKLIEELHINFLNSQFSYSQEQLKRTKSKHYLKEYGACFTSL